MWCACQGVPPLRFSAIHGPANSISSNGAAQANMPATDVSAIASATQPTCEIRIVLR